jgi:3-methyladenine DNA glycosylase/8-oxoguanine DNA glycosylase
VEHAAALAGLDDLPERFDPAPGLVRDLHRRYLGVRIGRSARVVDSLVASILGQKVTSREAHRSYRSLVGRYGAPAPGPVELLVPPPPGLLAALPTYEYHGLGIERRRAETIKRVAARSQRMEEAASMPSPEASRRLQAVLGVGPWTAALVLGSALGDPDAVPVGDYHIPDTVAWNLAGEPRGDDRRMLELLEPFRGQRGRVIWLLKVGGRRPPAYGPRKTVRDIRPI